MSSDLLKSVANLIVSEILAILLEDEGVVGNVVATLEGSVDLMEGDIVHILNIFVATGVKLSSLCHDNGSHLSLSHGVDHCSGVGRDEHQVASLID